LAPAYPASFVTEASNAGGLPGAKLARERRIKAIPAYPAMRSLASFPTFESLAGTTARDPVAVLTWVEVADMTHLS